MARDDSEVQNMLSRLAESIEANVLPHVTDAYTRMQVRAARELLLNLSTRLSWQEDHQPAQGAACSAIAPLQKDLTAHPQPTLIDDIDGIYQLDGAAREAALDTVWRAIRADFEREATRIKTGMYS